MGSHSGMLRGQYAAKSLAAGILAAAAVMAVRGQTPGAAGAGNAPGSAHVAGLLVNDARDVLRDPALPADAAARQAVVLLELATRMDETDLRTLRLLAQVARAAEKTDVEKDALRKVIAADPGDFVSQVRYIDLLAAGSQALDDRARIFRGAFEQAALDPQIRSEMGLRLARFAEERGDEEGAKQLLRDAVKFNDVNVAALRDLVRLTGAGNHTPAAQVDRMKALAALLTANPYEPDAWLEAARLCEAASVHDRAADFLTTGTEQAAMNGTPLGGELWMEFAMEQAIAGTGTRKLQAFQTLQALCKLPDAPLTVLLAAAFLAQDNAAGPATDGGPTAGSSPAGLTTTRAAGEQLVPEIRKRLAELAKTADAGGAAGATALADAAGADLAINASAGPATAGWVEAYGKLVAPEDLTLARLRGWLLYRQGKLGEAQAIFEKEAARDPLAQVGLARVFIDQGKKEQAADQLQDLWATHPTGLLALQTAEIARRAGITLTESQWSRQVRDAAARLTPAVTGMHRSPRDVALMTVSYRKPSVSFGEPVVLAIRITNTSDRALPVGPDGVVKTTTGLAAMATGAATSMGIYGVDDLQRTYRLEPRQMMESTLRVDQGKVADALGENPGKTMTINVTTVTAPRVLSGSEFTTGLGGLVVAAGDFDRVGLPLSAAADVQRLILELGATTGERRLTRMEVAGAVLARNSGGPSALPEESRTRLTAALMPLAAAADPLVRATLIHAWPVGGLGEADKTVEGLSNDPEVLVRLMWLEREAMIARRGGEAAAGAVAALEKRATEEKDELLKEWLAAALPAAREAATRPAPASQPAATQKGN